MNGSVKAFLPFSEMSLIEFFKGYGIAANLRGGVVNVFIFFSFLGFKDGIKGAMGAFH